MPQPEADYEIDLDGEDRAFMAARRKAADLEAQEALRADRADRDLAVVQRDAAQSAGAEMAIAGTVTDDGTTVTFLDRRFRIADKVGLMPLLKFASASDMNTDDPRAMAAVYEMLRDCIHPGTPGCGECASCEAGNDTACKAYDPGDWAAFERHAIDTKADAEELLAVISQVMEILSGRPTQPPAGSSAGRRGKQGGSTANSSGTRAKASRR